MGAFFQTNNLDRPFFKKTQLNLTHQSKWQTCGKRSTLPKRITPTSASTTTGCPSAWPLRSMPSSATRSLPQDAPWTASSRPVWTTPDIPSSRVRTGRSIKGIALPPHCTRGERRAVEKIAVDALAGLEGEFKGKYFPLSKMTDAEQDHLRVISMQKGGDIKGVFKRFCEGLTKIETLM